MGGEKRERDGGGGEDTDRQTGTDRLRVPHMQCAYGNYFLHNCMVCAERAPRRKPFHAAPCSHVRIKQRCDHFCSNSKHTVTISVAIENMLYHFCS